MLRLKKGYVSGYFQVGSYYEQIRPFLQKQLYPREKPNRKNEEIIQKISSTNSVSLHVRRGDYLGLKNLHGICDLNYYQKAVNFIERHVENPFFFLFSDDPNWVKENLKLNHPYFIVDINKNEKSPWDMWLMSLCKHNIIANSSFSWWGAFLNQNEKNITIAPKVWFADGSAEEIHLKSWILL